MALLDLSLTSVHRGAPFHARAREALAGSVPFTVVFYACRSKPLHALAREREAGVVRDNRQCSSSRYE